MLSQKEIEFLRNPDGFNANYRYYLKHQIKNKVQALNEEFTLLQNAGFLGNLRDSSKGLRDFDKDVLIKKSSGNASFKELMVGPPGFEPESIEPKSTSLDQASRRPHAGATLISSASIKTLSTPNFKPLLQKKITRIYPSFKRKFE